MRSRASRILRALISLLHIPLSFSFVLLQVVYCRIYSSWLYVAIYARGASEKDRGGRDEFPLFLQQDQKSQHPHYPGAASLLFGSPTVRTSYPAHSLLYFFPLLLFLVFLFFVRSSSFDFFSLVRSPLSSRPLRVRPREHDSAIVYSDVYPLN